MQASNAPISLRADTTICEGKTVLRHAPAAPETNYRWSDGSTSATLPNVYSVQVRAESEIATPHTYRLNTLFTHK